MEDLLKVGVITTTHGVRGEVKVFPTTDPERFLDLEYVILDAGRKMKKLEIRNVKFFKNLVILKFNGIDNINDIEMYKGISFQTVPVELSLRRHRTMRCRDFTCVTRKTNNS